MPELAPTVRAEVERRVRVLLRCGYDDRAALAEAAEEYPVDGDNRPVSAAQARELVDRLWLMGVPLLDRSRELGGGWTSRRRGRA